MIELSSPRAYCRALTMLSQLLGGVVARWRARSLAHPALLSEQWWSRLKTRHQNVQRSSEASWVQ